MSADSTAIRNRVLSIVDPSEFEGISRFLEPVDLPLRHVLSRADERCDHVYFLENGVASMVIRMSDGLGVEVGTIGFEGMAGMQAALDSAVLPIETFMQVAGDGYRMTAEHFTSAVRKYPSLRHALIRYAQVLVVQVAQTVACNRLHLVMQRCARWLLMTQDRVSTESFLLTHEGLAYMLGVRRASVSEAAAELQRMGLIRYSRGVVTVLRRDGLEAAACECYGRVNERVGELMQSGRGSQFEITAAS